ncbi:MAG: hypothetical protein NT013_02830 [Planctomycetia bacterium]|nr:hypothetical protein [Planctomycetia bacterium]
MEQLTMGKVTANAAIGNLGDLMDADRGRMPNDQVRRINVTDALVDTGAPHAHIASSIHSAIGANSSPRSPRTHGGRHGDKSLFTAPSD